MYTHLIKYRRISLSFIFGLGKPCLLYTSDAADDGESVDLGGRRIIKKKKKKCFFFFSFFLSFFFFQAEDGIRDQPRSRGLGDVYKRQVKGGQWHCFLQTVQTSTYVCNAFQNLF